MAFTPGMNEQVSVQVNSEGGGEFNDTFDEAVGRLGSFRAAVGAAGAALAALGAGGMAAAIATTNRFNQALVELEKVTSAATADELANSIQRMSTEIPKTHEALTGLATQAARFGIEGTENIERFTRSVSKMATATEMNTREAGESLAKISTITDTPTEKIENLGSAINTMGNNFATSGPEVVEATKRSAAALSSLGLQQTQIIGVTTALNEVSASSRRAGTRLRALGNELMAPEAANTLAGPLGLTSEQFVKIRNNDPTELIRRMAETLAEGGESASALRGELRSTSRVALQGLAGNLDGLDSALKSSNESFEQGTSLQKEFEAQTDTLQAEATLLKNRLRNVGIEIGNVLIPHLRNAISAFNDAITPLIKFNRETEGMAGAVALLGMVVGGTAAALAAFGPSLAAIGSAIAGIPAAIGGTAASLAAFATGPVGLAIAAVIALAAAYKTNFAGIQDRVNAAMSAVKSAISRVLGPIDSTEDAVNALGQVYEDVFAGTVNDLLVMWGDLFESVEADVSAVLDSATKNAKALGGVFATAFGEIRGSMGDVRGSLDKYLALVRDVHNRTTTALAAISDAFASAFKWISTNVIRPLLSQYEGLIKTHMGGIVTEVSQTVNVLIKRFRFLAKLTMKIVRPFLNLLTAAWDMFGSDILAAVEFAFDGIRTTVVIILDALMTAISATLNLIQGDFDEALSDVLGFWKRTFGRIASFWGEWSTRFLERVGEVVGKIWNYFKGLTTDIFRAFVNAFSRLKTRLTTFRNDITSAFSNFATQIGNTLRQGFNEALNLPYNFQFGPVNVAGEQVLDETSITIPGLAEGGLVEGPTIAALAEGGQSEVVAPLDKFERMVGAAGGGAASGREVVVRFEGNDALVDLVRSEANVVVEDEFESRERRAKRLNNRGGT